MQLTLDRKGDPWFWCRFPYAVSKVFIFFLPCAMSISFRDSLLFGKQRRDKETWAIFPQPLFISRRPKKIPGTEDAFESEQFEISLIRNLLGLISAVSNSTRVGENTTSEAAEATTVSTTEATTVSKTTTVSTTEATTLSTTDSRDVLPTVQGLWFCHAHCKPRFVSLRRKSQGNEVDWCTFSSSIQCNLPWPISFPTRTRRKQRLKTFASKTSLFRMTQQMKIKFISFLSILW